MPKYLSEEDIEKLFTFRKWTPAEVDMYRPLREEARQLAQHINEIVPDCPQKTRAINALHEAVYIVNTAATLYPVEGVEEK